MEQVKKKTKQKTIRSNNTYVTAKVDIGHMHTLQDISAFTPDLILFLFSSMSISGQK